MPSHLCFKCGAAWQCAKCRCEMCPACGDKNVQAKPEKQSASFELPYTGLEDEQPPQMRGPE